MHVMKRPRETVLCGGHALPVPLALVLLVIVLALAAIGVGPTTAQMCGTLEDFPCGP